MPIGFRVRANTSKVAPDIVEQYRSLPVANVSDAMSRIVAGGAALRPMHRHGMLAGPALTVKTRPGDNLMLHKAIDMAEPGDVIVVDGAADTTNSLMGELMLEHAIMRGVAGFVIYGAIRDAETIHERNHPVFAVGVSHRGPYRMGPGEIGFPIAMEGMVIHPGDLILGDQDGVVCVAREDVHTVLKAAQAKQEAETRQMAATRDRSIDRSWVDKELARLGSEFVD